jgi:hypothetical protein
MQVFIIDQGFNHSKRFQIMTQKAGCFYHVYPGKLFTLEGAKAQCSANGYTVEKIGSIWQCASK